MKILVTGTDSRHIVHVSSVSEATSGLPLMALCDVSVWNTVESDPSIEMCDLCVGVDNIEQVFGEGGA